MTSSRAHDRQIRYDGVHLSGSRSLLAARMNRGFTLVELLMVIALIGILSTMVIINVADFKNSAKIARCAGELRGLEKDIISFATEKGDYPADLAVLGSSIVSDPWNRAYIYKKTADISRTWIGQPLNTDFDLYSLGNDGITSDEISDPGALDDILRGDDGAFCNISRKYALP